MVEVVPVVIGALGSVTKKDLIARDAIQCWSNSKNCFAGNGKDFEESVGNVKKRQFC